MVANEKISCFNSRSNEEVKELKHYDQTNLPDSAPVIIHGAGRSGSTLLLSLLRGHREFYIPHELSFLVPRLYNSILNESPFLHDWLGNHRRHLECNSNWMTQRLTQQNGSKKKAPLHDEWCSIERTRIAKELGEFIKKILIGGASGYKFWGFKEIWNGGPSFNHPWNIYEEVFNSPKWIHIVRHPLDYLRSMAGNHGIESPSKQYCIENLRYWVSINEKSMMLSSRRCLRVRYEDLVSEPETTLKNICKFIGMAYQPAALELMKHTYVPGKVKAQQVKLEANDINGIFALRNLCEIYEYQI